MVPKTKMGQRKRLPLRKGMCLDLVAASTTVGGAKREHRPSPMPRVGRLHNVELRGIRLLLIITASLELPIPSIRRDQVRNYASVVTSNQAPEGQVVDVNVWVMAQHHSSFKRAQMADFASSSKMKDHA